MDKSSITNGRIRVDIAAGSIDLTDISRGTATSFSDGFSIECEDAAFASEKAECRMVSTGGREAVFAFEDGEFDVLVRYSLPEEGNFFEKQISFRRKNGKSCMVKHIVCEKAVFARKPREIHFHDDQTLWHVPTNLFVRYDGGGIYCGLEYPYWELEIDGNSGFTLGFEPNYTLDAGETFAVEKSFWGIWRVEGVRRYSHGPYMGAKRFNYPEVVNLPNSGFPQHVADPEHLPEDAGIEPEELDWGEVWAMQEFFRIHLPMQPLPEEGYWVWQNGWWARLNRPDIELLEPLRRAGIHDIMTAAMYYGHDNHPSTEPNYIADVRIEPLGFPVYADKAASASGHESGAFHEHTKEQTEKREIVGYTGDFCSPDDYDRFIKQALERGFYVASFETPNNFYRERPEWGSLNENGENHRYFGSRISCPACDDYMDFRYEMICAILDKYPARLWSFDGRWLSYLEFAGYGNGEIRQDPCFSGGHGHLPGDNRYKEWKNIEKFKAKLRARYPNICLEQFYGMKRGGAWGLEYVNSDENIYEASGPDNNRFQTWHNENSRFRPVYLNYTALFGETPAELEYSMLSSLSTSAYAQVAMGYNALRDYPEAAELFRRWVNWGSDNHEYLKRRRCIFSYPGDQSADGSAHIIGSKGYIFIFSPTGGFADARVTLDRLIGLDEEEEAVYSVETVASVRSDGKATECAAPRFVGYGGELRCRVSPKTALLLHIAKVPGAKPEPLSESVFTGVESVAHAF